MKGSTLSSRDKSLLGRVETPTGEVSLMQRVETKFLAGINLNTLLIIHIQHLTIFYNKIPCKALHWCANACSNPLISADNSALPHSCQCARQSAPCGH